MSNQKRIQRPAPPNRKRVEVAPELPGHTEQLTVLEQSFDAIDQLLSEYDAPPSAEHFEVITAPQQKPSLRASSDEDFVRAFRQEVGQ